MKKEIWIALVIVFVIAGVGVFSLTNNSSTGNVVKKEAVKEFNVDAFQFGYTPNVITVNKGDKVKIIINNTDVPHGIVIPDMNVNGENVVEFNAEVAGEFTWYCLIPCGPGHRTMQGKIIVK